ncbi:MAG: T9SS type A sorting domain-containing protein [Bacteroidales bacterium]|nr:T9SS type A sorting domain-containing protein [Bacteroidales bacterium]
MKNQIKLTLALILLCFVQANAINVTWENETIGRYIITEGGTYTIKGTVIGCITVDGNITETVYIEGPGTLDDYDEGYRLQGNGGPEPTREHRFTILCGGDTKVIIRDLNVFTNSGHKSIWMAGAGSRIENCNVECVKDRNLAAMAVQSSAEGVIDNVWAKPNDDCFKVNRNNAIVKNSTAVMQGNGSAITLDYNNSHSNCFANNCTIRGKSKLKIRDINDTRANSTALCMVNNGDVQNIQFTDIRVEDGTKFAHIIKIMQKMPGATVQDVLVTGTLPDGAARYTHPDGNTSSPVTINALDGVIKNVTIDFGGALSDQSLHFLNGELINVCIDGHLYNGNFNNKFGNQVNSTSCDAPPAEEFISLLGNNGMYVSSENGNNAMNCNRASVGAWEEFKVVDAGNGKIALQGNNGKYVNNGSPMWCNLNSITNAAKFTKVDAGGGKFALLSNNGNYVCSENGLTPMNCNRTAIGNWEKFTWNTIVKSASENMANTTELSVYPNPASAELNVLLSTNTDAEYAIMSMTGATISQGVMFDGKTNIDVSELATGMYILQVRAGSAILNKKVNITR